MQILRFDFPADAAVVRPVHIGVVASGDLEILLAPHEENRPADRATVRVRTSVDGFDTVWRNVLERAFGRGALAGHWEINDAGATPGVVALRLSQAFSAATDANTGQIPS